MNILYSKDQIKKALFNYFNEEGELFFDYLGSKEENERYTESFWDEFSLELDKVESDSIPCLDESNIKKFIEEAGIDKFHEQVSEINDRIDKIGKIPQGFGPL